MNGARRSLAAKGPDREIDVGQSKAVRRHEVVRKSFRNNTLNSDFHCFEAVTAARL